MATIAEFLKSIGMAEYAAGLSESGIDDSAIQGLTERDLERLGVAPADRTGCCARSRGFTPTQRRRRLRRSVPTTASSAGI